jgi:predicted nucleic acid-binding protein
MSRPLRIEYPSALHHTSSRSNYGSVCDSWIIATAIAIKSILVHKEPEFEQVKKIVLLKTLPYKGSKTK